MLRTKSILVVSIKNNFEYYNIEVLPVAFN